MAATNQEVINETSVKSDEFKLQVESLEQQMRADKRFMEEQAIEREGEREEFTRKIELLQDIIKKKEKEEDAKISLLSKKVSMRCHRKSLLYPLRVVLFPFSLSDK